MNARQVVLCLQGGGALTAYQTGVVRALLETGFQPTIVVGSSTGAINAGVLVAHRHNDPDAALAALWRDLARPRLPFLPDLSAALGAYGHPAMYMPHGNWLQLGRWNALYDTKPLKRTLTRHVDQARLADTSTQPRLILTATNLDTGRGDVFDAAAQPLGIEHLLAATALPPTFPAVAATSASGARHMYWDGSVGGPPPMRAVLDRVPADDIALAVIVDLFPARGGVPDHMGEVGARMLEVLSADRNGEALAVLGDRAVIIAPEQPEKAIHVADFSSSAVDRRQREGYADARAALDARRSRLDPD